VGVSNLKKGNDCLRQTLKTNRVGCINPHRSYNFILKAVRNQPLKVLKPERWKPLCGASLEAETGDFHRGRVIFYFWRKKFQASATKPRRVYLCLSVIFEVTQWLSQLLDGNLQ